MFWRREKKRRDWKEDRDLKVDVDIEEKGKKNK